MATVIDLDNPHPDLEDVYERAAGGEEIVIARGSGPKLRLVTQPVSLATAAKRVPGRYHREIREAPGVWDPMTDDELREIGLL